MQAMFRPAALRIAGIPAVERFMRESPASRSLVERFVAGETLDEAIERSRALVRQGMTVTLDQLGENVHEEGAARQAADRCIAALRRMAEAGLEPNISVKLTMLGLDIAESLAADGLERLLAAASDASGFVRVDMEGSAYTQRTVDLVGAAHSRYPEQVGTVIQSCLHRSDADIDWAIERAIRIRLVKGAYAEPASVAWQGREEIDRAYIRQMERLLDRGVYPAIATHDTAIIRAARGYAERMGIGGDRFEFQMLYGVRRDLQQLLVREGCRMRVYVPFGAEWYPYFTRRIAERPANALFVLRQFTG